MTGNITNAARGISIVAVVAFLAVLVWCLARPGYTHVRLGFFALLGSLAIVGAIGVIQHSTRLVTVGSGGLFLLGFWQAVLWLYIYPVIGLLVVATLLDSDGTNPTTPAP